MLISKKLKLIFIFFLSTFISNCESDKSKFFEEIKFGSHEYFLNKFGGVYENALLQNYITSLGSLISNSMKLNEYKLNFYILNSSSLNIFSSNKKNIYITRGIIILCNNESQLANLLAHQLAHIKANHNPIQRKSYISWNKNLSTYQEDKVKENLSYQPLKIKLPLYSYSQEDEANKISIDALNRISFSFNDYININKSVKKFLKFKYDLYSWKELKYDIQNIHPSSEENLKKFLDKYGSRRQKNPIKGRQYFLKKIDGTVYEDLRENKIIVRSPRTNESFESFTLRNGIVTNKSKELFMILNDLTNDEIDSKKKLKIIIEQN